MDLILPETFDNMPAESLGILISLSYANPPCCLPYRLLLQTQYLLQNRLCPAKYFKDSHSSDIWLSDDSCDDYPLSVGILDRKCGKFEL